MTNDVDEMNKLLEITGDIAAATGLTFRETAEQLQRSFAAGINSADRFRERGVRALLGFEAGVNITAAETRKHILAMWDDDATNRLKGGADRLSGTWDGLMSMLSDRWFQFRQTVMDAGLFDFLKGMIREVLDAVNRDFGSMKKAGEAFSQSVIEAIQNFRNFLGLSASTNGPETIFDRIGEAVDKLQEKLTKLLRIVLSVLLAAKGAAVGAAVGGPIGAGLGGLAGALGGYFAPEALDVVLEAAGMTSKNLDELRQELQRIRDKENKIVDELNALEASGANEAGVSKMREATSAMLIELDKQAKAVQRQIDVIGAMPAPRPGGQTVVNIGGGAGGTTEETVKLTKAQLKEVDKLRTAQMKLREEHRVGARDILEDMNPVLAINRQYREDIEMLTAAYDDGFISAQEFAEGQGYVSQQLKDAQREATGLADVFDDLGRSFDGWTSSMVRGTFDAKQALMELGITILETAQKAFFLAQSGGEHSSFGGVLGSLFGKVLAGTMASGSGVSPTGADIGGTPFAKGGVFNHGNVVPFAGGALVNGPVMFPMSGGRSGLMGESGPEAIVPLERGPGGKLGIGGGGSTVVQIFDQRGANAPDTEVEQTTGPDGMKAIKVFIRAEINKGFSDGSFDRAQANNYGVQRTPARRG